MKKKEAADRLEDMLHRYRPAPPRKFFFIARRNGDLLVDADTTPRRWGSDYGIPFRTYAAATEALSRYFVSPASAFENGIHIVQR